MASSDNVSDSPVRARTPLLLITDIGSDIDDTLALLTIAGLSDVIHLVGVATTGGHALERAGAVRGWLRRLGFQDEAVAVAADDDRPEHPGKDCHVPDGFPTLAEGLEELSLYSSAASLILELAEAHAGKLVIVCIGPVTPLAMALLEDVQGILCDSLRGVLFQASVAVGIDGRLAPTEESFNFREDMESARKVVEELQDTVPLTFLTKYAAYQVGITTADFREWDRPGLPSMSTIVHAQMNRFRQTSPEIFYNIYEVAEDKRSDDDWFCNLKDDIVSRPYDPLVILLIAFPDLFTRRLTGKHATIGPTHEDHCVPSGDAVRTKLKALISAAFDQAFAGGDVAEVCA